MREIFFDEEGLDMFSQLLYNSFLPKIRQCLKNNWEARDYDPAIELINAWSEILPSPIQKNILEQMILPKLRQEVEHWNPREDRVPIHEWVHPWLPVLVGRMEPLLAPIRQKLAVVLQEWHPSDPSAHAILVPWKNVFDEKSMETLLLRCILPKLTVALRQCSINPYDQDLAPFQWVMTWQDFIPQNHFVLLLENDFFPRWLNVLRLWLHNAPNYGEVSRWYLGWKSRFPAELVNHDRIRTQFTRALDVMNTAVAQVAN